MRIVNSFFKDFYDSAGGETADPKVLYDRQYIATDVELNFPRISPWRRSFPVFGALSFCGEIYPVVFQSTPGKHSQYSFPQVIKFSEFNQARHSDERLFKTDLTEAWGTIRKHSFEVHSLLRSPVILLRRTYVQSKTCKQTFQWSFNDPISDKRQEVGATLIGDPSPIFLLGTRILT